MNFTFSGTRALVAIVAIAGVTGTTATTASAASTKTHVRHAKAKRLHKKTVARPDLVASGLNLALSDDGFDVTASIANTGKALAKRSDVVIALSDDTTLDENDTVLDEYSLGSVGAGVTRSFEDDVEMPDDLDAGTAYLLVCADGNEEVTESNETNNCVSQEVDTTDSSDDSSASDDGSDDSSDDGSDDDDAADNGAIVLTGGQQQ